MLQLIDVFKYQDCKITYASTALKSDNAIDLSNLGIDTTTIQLNNDNFDMFIDKLQPNIVIFDRFIIEEQFGWRVAETLPNTIRILDTEDLHSLRRTREVALKENKKFNTLDLLESDIAKREIASILRCDLSLIISTFEMEILKNLFKINSSILHYMPFLLDKMLDEQIDNLPKFEQRNNFYFIGNFIHKPNYDAVLYLKKEIWPLLSKELPKAELHIYGAYASQKVLQLNQPKERFYIKGKLDNIKKLKNYKICLAPLRFGAGIKGKLTEAMQYGTPSITTDIGAEGMHANLKWNGIIENTVTKIVSSAKELYTNSNTWKKAQNNGFTIINKLYNKEIYKTAFIKNITEIKSNLKQHRTSNFLGELLHHHTLKSVKYLSKWIEEKNKN
ncbi:MAG TPA: glycosyltransferase [Flavobacteriaceae bacterium]|nr:glycosyltransferase [Flavobacteriaceae bacterium]